MTTDDCHHPDRAATWPMGCLCTKWTLLERMIVDAVDSDSPGRAGSWKPGMPENASAAFPESLAGDPANHPRLTLINRKSSQL
jgi:hypothetical protein